MATNFSILAWRTMDCSLSGSSVCGVKRVGDDLQTKPPPPCLIKTGVPSETYVSLNVKT